MKFTYRSTTIRKSIKCSLLNIYVYKQQMTLLPFPIYLSKTKCVYLWVLLKNYAFWASMKRMSYTETLVVYSNEINGVSDAWIIKWIFQNQISPLSSLYFEIFQRKGQFCLIFRHPFCDMDLCLFVSQVFQRILLTEFNKKWPWLEDYVISFKSIPNFPKNFQRFSH